MRLDCRVAVLIAFMAAPPLSSCGSTPFHDGIAAISIHLGAGDGSVSVRIENAAGDPVTVRNPWGLWVVPGSPGLQLRIADANGTERLMCAMVDPSPGALGNSTVVPARSSISDDIEIGFLARIFCLGPGRYRVAVVLRDARTDSRASVVARSDWTDFVVTAPP
jgi:hypothetical protein